MFSKFIGITSELSTLIESRRQRADQSECDILIDALRSAASQSSDEGITFDLGQGAELRVGERLYLFLTKAAKDAAKPDGLAEVRRDGIYIEGKKVSPSNKSLLQPAMVHFQRRLAGPKADLTSLSAWRQWHVERDGVLVPIFDLKTPALARRRGRKRLPNLHLEDLNL